MNVIVGLGNPGLEYASTRHNAGFMVIDHLLQKAQGELKQSASMKCLYCKTKLRGHDVILVKPITYMNLSGQAVQALLHWYKIQPEQMMVVHDDVSLHLGRLRFQKGGGAGGQHGVESIIQCLSGNKGFDRLKFGVGPDPGGATRGDYVLSRFAADSQPTLVNLLKHSEAGILDWLKNGIDHAANAFNGKNYVVSESENKVI